MVSNRQQAVSVRRQVDPGDLAAVREHDQDQAGTLVREAVVVVAPSGGGKQDVQAGDARPPGQTPCFLEPLAVLHRVGGADHGKRLVRGEHAVAPSEGVTRDTRLIGDLGG